MADARDRDVVNADGDEVAHGRGTEIARAVTVLVQGQRVVELGGAVLAAEVV